MKSSHLLNSMLKVDEARVGNFALNGATHSYVLLPFLSSAEVKKVIFGNLTLVDGDVIFI